MSRMQNHISLLSSLEQIFEVQSAMYHQYNSDMASCIAALDQDVQKQLCDYSQIHLIHLESQRMPVQSAFHLPGLDQQKHRQLIEEDEKSN